MKLLLGDCREVMAGLDADSVDAIVTDPPYGLSFMGKGWDHGIPGIEFWAEAFRVAKPGAHLLAFGGTRTFHRLTCAIEDAGFEIRDCLSWLYGSGFPKSHNIGGGRGTALKPAWEPVIMARKPLVGTVAANVTRFGTGAINVDATRIGTDPGYSYPNGPGGCKSGEFHYQGRAETPAASNPLGRWPPNVLLDPEAGCDLDERFGDVEVGPSRYFYTAKACRAEREEGLVGPLRRGGGMQGTNDQTLLTGSGNERNPWARNHHPTVKPVDLMRWLVRLVTPPGGTVLDPFMGSGSTGIAAKLEGFDFIGIEKEPEYLEIATRRIGNALSYALRDEDEEQPSLFGQASMF